jgi:hypothetical protein
MGREAIRLVLILTAALVAAPALVATVARPLGAAEDQPAPEAPAPRPRPTPDDVASQTRLVREAFAKELRENREFPLETARTLLAATRDTTDPARAWALFDESLRLATEARSLPDALAVATERARVFGLDPGEEIVAALSATANQDGADMEAVFRLAVAVAKDATTAEHFPVANDAIDVAAAAVTALAPSGKKAARGQQRKPAANVEPLRRELQAVRTLFTDRERRRAAYDAACETLAGAPDDPVANTQAGMYLCVVRGDWRQGVERLAKSGTAAVSAAATADMSLAQAAAPDVRAVLDVGEQWWRVASSLPDADDAEAFRRHVADMYEQVADKASDPLDKKLIDQRRKQARR